MSKLSRPSRYLGVTVGLLLGAFGLLWIYTAHARANFLPETYGTWRAVIRMANRCETSDVAVIGASQASVAIIPQRLGLDASVKNFALTTSTPVEGYYMARRLFACPAPPKTVVLIYSGFDFAGSDFFWERAPKYGLLDFAELQEVARTAREVGDTHLYRGSYGSEPPPALKNFLYASHFPPFDTANLIAAKGFMRRARNDQVTDEALAEGGEHLLGNGSCTKWLAWESYQDRFQPTRLNAVYFDRLLTLIHEHGARALFVSPPLSDTSYRQMHGRYADDYRAFISKVREAHPELRVPGPLFPILDHCYFTDSLHLNERGAQLFSRTAGEMIGSTLGVGSAGVGTVATEAPALSARAPAKSSG